MRVDELQDKLRVIQDEIIDVKARLQKEIPTSELILDDRHWISKRMVEIKDQYDDLLDDLDLFEGKVEEIPSLDEKLTSDINPDSILFLVCRNAMEEKLEEISNVKFDVLQTGGPLEAEAYRKLNSSIPVKALVNIEKKIKKTFDQIIKRASEKACVVLLGIDRNEVDSLLFESVTPVALKTGKDTFYIALNSMDEINAETILKKIIKTIKED